MPTSLPSFFNSFLMFVFQLEVMLKPFVKALKGLSIQSCIALLAYGGFLAVVFRLVAVEALLSGAGNQPFELICIGKEVLNRKCVVAAGWYVRDGFYILAIGQTAVGLIAIGQLAIGLVSIGQIGAGLLFSAVLAGACTGVICGLIVAGTHSPRCLVGLTLVKDDKSAGVLHGAIFDTTKSAVSYERLSKKDDGEDRKELAEAA